MWRTKIKKAPEFSEALLFFSPNYFLFLAAFLLAGFFMTFFFGAAFLRTTFFIVFFLAAGFFLATFFMTFLAGFLATFFFLVAAFFFIGICEGVKE